MVVWGGAAAGFLVSLTAFFTIFQDFGVISRVFSRFGGALFTVFLPSDFAVCKNVVVQYHYGVFTICFLIIVY